MKYYVVADTHAFFDEMIVALTEKGYFSDKSPHKLIICGDLLDRGKQPLEMQEFVMQLLKRDEVILIRGNHEDLFEKLLLKDAGLPTSQHMTNGTYQTALTLTGFTKTSAFGNLDWFLQKARSTPFYQTIIPSSLDYFETKNYIFVHGWIPVDREKSVDGSKVEYLENWRNESVEKWKTARWLNGMDAFLNASEPNKTIICGHKRCSYGHAVYEKKGEEVGQYADYSPFFSKGIIAIDACTALSGVVNCIVVED